MSTSEIHNLHGQRQFHPPRPGGEEPPSDHSKHKPGVKASPYDRVSEFEGHAVPPGTAPKENVFTPQPNLDPSEMRSGPPQAGVETTGTTLGGTTSGDVHQGFGKPMKGQTNTEIRHEGGHHRERGAAGLQGVGANDKGTRADLARLQRDDDVQKGDPAQDKGIPAEEQLPQSSEFVASEEDQHSRPGGRPART